MFQGAIRDLVLLKKSIPVTLENFSFLDKPLLHSSSSPCPSPLPVFQQLYHAVTYLERILSDSPDKCTRKYFLDNNLSLKFGSLDETDDENSSNNSPRVESMKRGLSVNLSEINEIKDLYQRRKSSPAELPLSEDKNKKQNFIKIRIIDDNS